MVSYILFFLDIAYKLKIVCVLFQTDLVGEIELDSVMQRIKVGSTSSGFCFSL